MKLTRRQQRWLVRPLSGFVYLLGKTWRIRRQGFPASTVDPQFIEAAEHGQMLFVIHLFQHQNVVSMVSEHRDGEMIADIAERFGAKIVRGSSTRGGARAYLEMLKRFKDYGWMITPDGPRGPKGSVHEGIIKMASDTGRAIRPHGFAASSAKKLRSWDEFTIPYPFARVVQFVGDPLHVPPHVDRETRLEFAKDLERRMREANHQAQLALTRLVRTKRTEDHDAAAQPSRD